jgi:hypothetical protein
MKQQNKLSPEQQQKQTAEQQTQQSPAREFATAEELLRYDAAQTMVPPGIAQRLQQSVGELPRPRRSWWQRLFGN